MASWVVSLAAGMGIPMTEKVGRALRDGPADAEPDAEGVEGRRREAQDFGEGGGATGVAADVGGAASGGGTAVVEGVGAVDVAGTITGFSADIRVFDEACSSIDMEPASLLNPTSFPSSVLATDNEVCGDAGDWVGVSVVSVTVEDGTLEFVREAQATP